MSSLEIYCETLYGSSVGYVYTPSKDPNTNKWKQRWWSWPAKKEEMYEYIRERSRSQEIYIAPPLYGSRSVANESIRSTRVVWAEFDGTLPRMSNGIPKPNFRIQSSIRGHEHWYWILDNPLKDTEILSLINKKLAYELNADKCWDATRVLRPPTTIHHESGKIVALKGDITDSPVAIESFAELESPDSLQITEVTEADLVDPEILLAVYEWSHDTYDLYKKEIPKGKRDEALTRLAFDCSEMGMADNEIVTILKEADDRWGKFVKRTDRYRRLTAIVRYVRSKQQIKQITDAGKSSQQALGFQDFMRLEIKMDWIVKGIIPVAGQAVLFGAPGCGKTSLSLRTAMAVARGDNYLNWQVLKKKRSLFVSAEMPHEELNEFFGDMQITDIAILQENFFIFPLGHAFPLNNKNNQAALLEMIDKHHIEIVWLDSLSVVAGGSTNDDQTILNLNHWIDKYVRKNRGVSVVYLHHNRKPDKFSGDYQSAATLAQLYGSQFISAGALTVIGMERPGRDKAILYYTKGRYFREDQLKLIATDNRDFEVADGLERELIKEEKKQNDSRSKSKSDSTDSKDSDGDERLFKFV